MPESRSVEPFSNDVLTLEEAANYLRISNEEMARLADTDQVPCQRVGDNWRFLKSALMTWLKLGRHYSDVVRRFPYPLLMDPLFFEDWFAELRNRIVHDLREREDVAPPKGSKEALSKYFGILRGKEDPDETLASLRKIRAEAGQ